MHHASELIINQIISPRNKPHDHTKLHPWQRHSRNPCRLCGRIVLPRNLLAVRGVHFGNSFRVHSDLSGLRTLVRHRQTLQIQSALHHPPLVYARRRDVRVDRIVPDERTAVVRSSTQAKHRNRVGVRVGADQDRRGREDCDCCSRVSGEVLHSCWRHVGHFYPSLDQSTKRTAPVHDHAEPRRKTSVAHVRHHGVRVGRVLVP